MNRVPWLTILGLAAALATGSAAGAAAALHRLCLPRRRAAGRHVSGQIGRAGARRCQPGAGHRQGRFSQGRRVLAEDRSPGSRLAQGAAHRVEAGREAREGRRAGGARPYRQDREALIRVRQPAGVRLDREPGVCGGGDRAGCRSGPARTQVGDAAGGVEPARFPGRPVARSVQKADDDLCFRCSARRSWRFANGPTTRSSSRSRRRAR